MNRVNLSTTAGKWFWASLVGYCVAFGGFYLTTQHTQNRIYFEEKQGVFLGFNEAICKNGQYCNEVKYENRLVDEQREYSTFVDVIDKKNATHNIDLMQKNYTEFLSTLPWYVRMQFNNVMKIKTINGTKFKANEYE